MPRKGNFYLIYIGKILPAYLKKHQLQAYGRTFYIPKPCLTRWTPFLKTVDSLLNNKAASITMIFLNEFKIPGDIAAAVLDAAFWMELVRLKNLIKPLVQANIILQGFNFNC